MQESSLVQQLSTLITLFWSRTYAWSGYDVMHGFSIVDSLGSGDKKRWPLKLWKQQAGWHGDTENSTMLMRKHGLPSTLSAAGLGMVANLGGCQLIVGRCPLLDRLALVGWSALNPQQHVPFCGENPRWLNQSDEQCVVRSHQALQPFAHSRQGSHPSSPSLLQEHLPSNGIGRFAGSKISPARPFVQNICHKPHYPSEHL